MPELIAGAGLSLFRTTSPNDVRVDLNATPTGFFYEEDGADIGRLAGRFFVGDAIENLGTNIGSQPDWLTTFFIAHGRDHGFQHVAQLAVLGQTGAYNAVVGAARTNALTINGNATGILGVAISDNATHTTSAYAGYFEAYRASGTLGGAYGIEIDTINLGALVSIDPFAEPAGQTIGLQIAAGAEYAGTSDASAAINIRNNGARFERGIVIGNDALTGCNGTTGTAPAIEMVKGHFLRWFGPGNVATSQVISNASTFANSATLVLSEGVLDVFNSSSGKIVFRIFNLGGSNVNYAQALPSVAGSAVGLGAQGDDTNIDLALIPKGTGNLKFGTFTSNADAAITGYVTIKDSGGTTRKLATIA